MRIKFKVAMFFLSMGLIWPQSMAYSEYGGEIDVLAVEEMGESIRVTAQLELLYDPEELPISGCDVASYILCKLCLPWYSWENYVIYDTGLLVEGAADYRMVPTSEYSPDSPSRPSSEWFLIYEFELVETGTYTVGASHGYERYITGSGSGYYPDCSGSLRNSNTSPSVARGSSRDFYVSTFHIIRFPNTNPVGYELLDWDSEEHADQPLRILEPVWDKNRDGVIDVADYL